MTHVAELVFKYFSPIPEMDIASSNFLSDQNGGVKKIARKQENLSVYLIFWVGSSTSLVVSGPVNTATNKKSTTEPYDKE